MWVCESETESCNRSLVLMLLLMLLLLLLFLLLLLLLLMLMSLLLLGQGWLDQMLCSGLVLDRDGVGAESSSYGDARCTPVSSTRLYLPHPRSETDSGGPSSLHLRFLRKAWNYGRRSPSPYMSILSPPLAKLKFCCCCWAPNPNWPSWPCCGARSPASASSPSSEKYFSMMLYAFM